MSQTTPPDPRHGRTPRRQRLEVRPAHIVAGVLLVVATLAPLLVSTYARSAPKLGAFPFFYWWQMALVIVAALLTGICYRLVVGAERKRRRELGLSERGGDTAGPRAAAGHAGPTGGSAHAGGGRAEDATGTDEEAGR